MSLSSLRIMDFRNLKNVDLALCRNGFNLIGGNNGSGKTSLLEAIHYLGLGRSFRSSNLSSLIRHTTSKFSIFVQLILDNDGVIPIGTERTLEGLVRMRVSEKDVSKLTEVASFLPIRVINSQSHHLFESGPIFRRKYLDWGLFYQSNQFLSCWQSFERALKQRNVILRSRRRTKEYETWTHELIKHASVLDHFRREYINQLSPYLKESASALLDISQPEILYSPGWDQKQEYATILFEDEEEEFRLGHTLSGPHRADVDIRINGVLAKHFLSRGQQKLLICGMIIAQGKLFTKQANKGLIYLIDDLPSELDLESRRKLISVLVEQQTQIFVTAIEEKPILDLIKNGDVPNKVFHVEQGDVSERGSR